MSKTTLDQLAALCGIANEYHDVRGNLRHVSDETRRRLLAAMGLDVRPDSDLEQILASVEEQRWQRRLEPVVIAKAGGATLVLILASPESDKARAIWWAVTSETGKEVSGRLDPDEFEVRERRFFGSEAWVSMKVSLPTPEEPGYYRLRLSVDADLQRPIAESLLICAPATCYRPEAVEDERRLWGLTAQLYGLRSQRNWGIGDFTDLVRLVEFAADQGASFVGLNPLHAPLSPSTSHASPYDPSSRKHLNTLYLDVEAIPDFEESTAARQRVADEQFNADLRSLRAAELVDYAAVGALKDQVLQELFDSFCRHHRGKDSARGRRFDQFKRDRKRSLYPFAAFQVLHEYWQEQDPDAWGWPAWPEEFQDCNSIAAAAVIDSHSDRLDYFMYLQWNAELQLNAASERAMELGMEIGLYTDLALSSKHGGADTWVDRDVYLRGAHLGAPPDIFNQAGQDWGLPPWNPTRLRAAGYRPFIETLRANMRMGGALRIDHAMSLMRCFLIPEGGQAPEGTYVYYPFDEMCAILAFESQRHECMVIGEDLGTVPEALRSKLGEIGVLGYRVLYFEKGEEGAYKSPAEFDKNVLTVISTHDLPTLAGFWQGADIQWRTEQDLFPGIDAREQHLVVRAEDRARLLIALEKEGLQPEEIDRTEVHLGAEMNPALRLAFHRYLAMSASLLVGVQAEDIVGEREQANLPGTTHEHPNWQRRLSLQIESWTEQAQLLAVLASVREERPGVAAQPSAVRVVVPPMRTSIPRATYRVQLHQGFRFSDIEGLVPYLDALGISHVYCSPYLKARAGSNHGYDIVDHSALNPEIGNRTDFERFCETLATHGMGHILDMVPNHMAVTGRDHDWWLDVLENGPASHYAGFFDIDWKPLKEELRGKVLLPVLGDHYGNILDHGDLELVFEPEHGRFWVVYFEHRFPVDPREYPQILEPDLELLQHRLPKDDPSLVRFESLITAFGNLPSRRATDEKSRRERTRDQKLHRGGLAALVGEAPDVLHYIDECLRVFNGDEQYPADTMRMHALLEAQPYRLAYWRVASDEINYRRFFDINDLASLRMESEEVFEATHAFVLELIETGKLQGLRIDHPDGLYDPRGYFQRVQGRFGASASTDENQPVDAPLYVLAEKILAGNETLRDDWPIHGTTGYEFANLLNRFLVSPAGIAELDSAYASFIGYHPSYEDILRRCKTLIMKTSLASELNVLTAELDRLAEEDPHTRDFGLGGLRAALLETIACFPVYRTYSVEGEVSDEDKVIIDHAVDTAKSLSEAADTSVFEFLRDVLLNRSAMGRGDDLKSRVAQFGMRLQQYTSPVAAKGMEDTAFYRYARLISLNEVGGTPERPTATAGEFHAANRERLGRWPHSMLASSTHDAKRSEDVRSRLHVLSEIPAEWRHQVDLWATINESRRNRAPGLAGIDRDTEYFLYQTLVGAWPLELSEKSGANEHREFAGRMVAYMIKAVKEAKRHTSWLNADEGYEKQLESFISELLDPSSNREFMREFLPFQRRVARLGLYNGVSQLVLKLTCPGVPDVYQGNELWRFDLVDPDNRRPVDFAHRQQLLHELQEAFEEGHGREKAVKLMDTIEDGRVKLFLTWRALAVRREHYALFEGGSYRPLEVTGEHASNVFAFSRTKDDVVLLVAVVRWYASFASEDSLQPDLSRLEGTVIHLPRDAGLSFVDGFTDEPVNVEDPFCVPASGIFSSLPVALWVGSRQAP